MSDTPLTDAQVGVSVMEKFCPADLARDLERKLLAAEERVRQLERALTAAKRLCDEALPKFNWGASALDANAIRLLNETPGVIRAALTGATADPKALTDDDIRKLWNEIIGSAEDRGEFAPIIRFARALVSDQKGGQT